jgi:hypothetical protein
MYLQKVIRIKTFQKKLLFVGVLKVIGEKSRIRIHLSQAWIRTKVSWVRNTGLHKPRMKKNI